MSTAIVWFRNDLRVADNPALYAAAEQYDAVIPLFIFDPAIIQGRHTSPNRLRFLLECLSALDAALQEHGGRLIVRDGRPAGVLAELARQSGASAVLAASDYSPLAIKRDAAVAKRLAGLGCLFKLFSGRLILDDPETVRSGSSRPYQVFTPFYNQWLGAARRKVLPAPARLSLPAGPAIGAGSLPELARLIGTAGADQLSEDVQTGGRPAAIAQLGRFLEGPVHHYAERHDDLAAAGTSRLSAYLHFGCLSPREVEAALPDSRGAAAFRRQLAWRDFYHYVLFHNPANTTQEFQARYRGFAWQTNARWLQAWKAGRTGYPVVDAAMRQLAQTGFMHNRARLIAGSFLTKDLGLDWRAGEAHFMRYLLDGDQANNNGNWQWIASVGVDPAPVFRRLYNPTSQAARYDPTGAYIRRWVPELAAAPAGQLYEPWLMTPAQQAQAHCRIGHDYPAPIVNHAEARAMALKRYRAAG